MNLHLFLHLLFKICLFSLLTLVSFSVKSMLNIIYQKILRIWIYCQTKSLAHWFWLLSFTIYCCNIRRISPPICELLSSHFYLLLFLRPFFDIFLIFPLLKYHLLYFLNFIVLCPDIKEKFPAIGERELLSSPFYHFLLLRPLLDFSLISFFIHRKVNLWEAFFYWFVTSSNMVDTGQLRSITVNWD